MSVWLDKTGRCPDGGHRPSGPTTMRPKFQKFHWKSFLFESCVQTVRHCHPDGRTSAASNFHIEAPRVWTRRLGFQTINLMHVCPDHVDCHPDVWIWIEIHALWMSVSGRESTSVERLQQSSHICVWKEILKLDRTLRVVWTGCWIIRTYANWRSSKLLDTEEGPNGNPRHPDGWCFSLMCIRTICHVVWTVDALDRWESGQYDTSSGRLAGNRIFWLANCAESSRTLLNSGIHDKKHLYKEVIFVQLNVTNYKLTISKTLYLLKPEPMIFCDNICFYECFRYFELCWDKY